MTTLRIDIPTDVFDRQRFIGRVKLTAPELDTELLLAVAGGAKSVVVENLSRALMNAATLNDGSSVIDSSSAERMPLGPAPNRLGLRLGFGVGKAIAAKVEAANTGLSAATTQVRAAKVAIDALHQASHGALREGIAGAFRAASGGECGLDAMAAHTSRIARGLDRTQRDAVVAAVTSIAALNVSADTYVYADGATHKDHKAAIADLRQALEQLDAVSYEWRNLRGPNAGKASVKTALAEAIAASLSESEASRFHSDWAKVEAFASSNALFSRLQRKPTMILVGESRL